MANREENVQAHNRTFYACVQITFNPGDEYFAIGDREEVQGAIVVDVYDKKDAKLSENCLLHFNKGKVLLQMDDQHIDLSTKEAWIDGGTPRYWFTNTNLD